VINRLYSTTRALDVYGWVAVIAHKARFRFTSAEWTGQSVRLFRGAFELEKSGPPQLADF
jgi:hypothetical protein